MADTPTQALISALFGALGGVCSSLVTSHINYQRDGLSRRKDSVSDVIEDIRVSASRYWQKGGIDKELESALKSALERLDVKIADLAGYRGSAALVLEAGADKLYSEITGGTFETIGRTASVDRVRDIRSAASILVDVVRKF